MKDVEKMSRKEINAEANHLVREQQEYAEEVAKLKKENIKFREIVERYARIEQDLMDDCARYERRYMHYHEALEAIAKLPDMPYPYSAGEFDSEGRAMIQGFFDGLDRAAQVAHDALEENGS